MHYAPFLSTVEQVGGLPRSEPQRAIEATLLRAARVGRHRGTKFSDMASQLPAEYAPLPAAPA
jgi:hypothetical protein